MSRKNVIAANWKMNMTPSETASFLDSFLKTFPEPTAVEIVLAPPFVSLPKAAELMAGQSAVGLSAQNMSHETSGAFTGEINAAMLKEVGCQYVILGHSERRSLYGENDVVINKKVHATLAAGLVPILCIGESLEERESGRTEGVVTEQVLGSLAGIPADDLAKIVVAYEPVWAIGTGKVATPQQAQDVHALVRSLLARLSSPTVADKIRIQYGGSVKPDNASELAACPDIDGALVGGASLKADDFLAIAKAFG